MKSISTNKKYKEEKRKILSDRKRASDIEKSKFSSSKKVATQKKTVAKDKVWVKKKKKSETRWQLVKKLDAIFSRYIRLRDADDKGICTCITCGDKKHRKEMHNTHFRSRSCYKYRWSEENCWAGCYKCNVILNWNYIQYTLAMINKFWKNRVEGVMWDHELTKISTAEIKDKIEEYSVKVKNIIK